MNILLVCAYFLCKSRDKYVHWSNTFILIAHVQHLPYYKHSLYKAYVLGFGQVRKGSSCFSSHTPLLNTLRLGAVASVAGKLIHCFIVLGKKLYLR